MWLREWFGIDGTPIELFSLGGMIFVEGLLFTPIAFLLTLPPLSAMDPALEEAAAMSGAALAGRSGGDAAAGAAEHPRRIAAVPHPRARSLRSAAADRHSRRGHDGDDGALPDRSFRLHSALWRGQRLCGAADGRGGVAAFWYYRATTGEREIRDRDRQGLPARRASISASGSIHARCGC